MGASSAAHGRPLPRPVMLDLQAVGVTARKARWTCSEWEENLKCIKTLKCKKN